MTGQTFVHGPNPHSAVSEKVTVNRDEAQFTQPGLSGVLLWLSRAHFLFFIVFRRRLQI
jgi:hypothetical protein